MATPGDADPTDLHPAAPPPPPTPPAAHSAGRESASALDLPGAPAAPAAADSPPARPALESEPAAKPGPAPRPVRPTPPGFKPGRPASPGAGPQFRPTRVAPARGPVAGRGERRPARFGPAQPGGKHFGGAAPGGFYPAPKRTPNSKNRGPTVTVDDNGWPVLGRNVRLIHEDMDLIVVDKPPGMLTASVEETTRTTIFDLVKEHVRARHGRMRKRRSESREAAAAAPGAARRGEYFAGVIHRLDKEASGLLVFSKTERALHWLKEDFKAKRVHRLYLAVVEGILGEVGASGTIQSFLQEQRDGRVVSIPTDRFRGPVGPASASDPDAARPAVTHYRIVAAGRDRTLVQVRLETGRKHQIRVHFAERGHPVVGDDRYNARTNPFGRLLLHATELGFTHIATGQKERYSSPAPPIFYTCVGAAVPENTGKPPASALAALAGAGSRAPAPQDTSWQNVAGWYDELLDERRSDHYDKVIVPGTLRLLGPSAGQRVLDVACGQGVISRAAAELGADVTGVDAAPALLEAARARSGERATYLQGDARELGALGLPPGSFDAATCIMALSNIEPLDPVLRGVVGLLKPGGAFVAVISHPAFRAASQTAWGWDEKERRQFRRVDGYLSPGQKPIQMHPGAAPGVVTWTFHRPLQTYVRLLAEAGFLLEALEEWTAMRTSEPGPRADEENRARREIPLFLALRAIRR